MEARSLPRCGASSADGQPASAVVPMTTVVPVTAAAASIAAATATATTAATITAAATTVAATTVAATTVAAAASTARRMRVMVVNDRGSADGGVDGDRGPRRP
jgi:hypothetical protein